MLPEEPVTGSFPFQLPKLLTFSSSGRSFKSKERNLPWWILFLREKTCFALFSG